MLAQQYASLLAIHGTLRWFVLLSALVAIAGCLVGLAGKRPFSPLGRVPGIIYVSFLDTQILVGILLSAASPIFGLLLTDPAAVMKQRDLRSVTVEHITLMLVAAALAHIGSIRSRRTPEASASYRVAAAWYAGSLAVILIGIPWWRPLLRT